VKLAELSNNSFEYTLTLLHILGGQDPQPKHLRPV